MTQLPEIYRCHFIMGLAIYVDDFSESKLLMLHIHSFPQVFGVFGNEVSCGVVRKSVVLFIDGL